MYDLLRTLNKELDSSIEVTFSNDLLKKELDLLYLKIQKYKSKEDDLSLQKLLKKLDEALDNTQKNNGLFTLKELDTTTQDSYAKTTSHTESFSTNESEISKNESKINEFDKVLLNQTKTPLNQDAKSNQAKTQNTSKSSNILEQTYQNKPTEKEEILSGLDFDTANNNLNFRQLYTGFLLFIFIVACLGSFVAVREKIYYNSREYGELISKKEVLLEEQKELKRKIESLQFQNNIMNYFDN